MRITVDQKRFRKGLWVYSGWCYSNHANMYKHKILPERHAIALSAFPGADKAPAGTQGSVCALIV